MNKSQLHKGVLRYLDAPNKQYDILIDREYGLVLNMIQQLK